MYMLLSPYMQDTGGNVLFRALLCTSQGFWGSVCVDIGKAALRAELPSSEPAACNAVFQKEGTSVFSI